MQHDRLSVQGTGRLSVQVRMDEVIAMDELDRRMDELASRLYTLQGIMECIMRDLERVNANISVAVSVTQQICKCYTTKIDTFSGVTQQN